MNWMVDGPNPWLGLGILVAGSFFASAMLVEWRQQGANWRKLTVVIVSLALMLLILQPSAKRTVDLDKAIILTPGATRQLAANHGVVVEPPAVSVALPGIEPWSSSTRKVPDLETFLRRNPQVDHLQIVGAGLEPWDAAVVSTSVEIVAPLGSNFGVATVSWTRRLTLGDSLQVTGRVVGLNEGTVSLGLEGPADSRVEKTLTAAAGGPLPFTLQLQPPGKGRFLYRFSVAGPIEGQASSEFVDVQVVASQLPAILWLEDAPSFETKYVKQWLADQSGRLAVRSRVSRERFHFEFHNLEEVTFDRLDPQILDRFDLVIAGQKAWEKLGTLERSVVMQAVANTGLGVLVRLNPALAPTPNRSWPFGFAAARVQDVEQLLVRPNGASEQEVLPLEIPPFELHLTPGVSPVVKDRVGRFLALERPHGKGNVGVTLLRETYPWVLEGNAKALHSYWRRVVEALARQDDGASWHLPPGPILVDEPLDLVLEVGTDFAGIPEVRLAPLDGADANVAMRQDPVVSSRWTARVWPSATGWYRLDGGGAQIEFHVAASRSWPQWQLQRRQRSTQLAALDRARPRSTERAQIDRPLPRLPFDLVVLLGLGLLWLHERRGSSNRS